MSEYKPTYIPRNDYVLLRLVSRDTVRGIAMPESSAQGKKWLVESFGPDVVGLKVGQEALPLGQLGEDIAALPSDPTLFLTKQSNIPVVVS